MGVGTVMFWASLTCFHPQHFWLVTPKVNILPHAKSGVFQSSLSVLSVYSAPCSTSFCPNISALNVWVLFSQLQLEVEVYRNFQMLWNANRSGLFIGNLFCKLNISSHFSVIFFVVLLDTFFQRVSRCKIPEKLQKHGERCFILGLLWRVPGITKSWYLEFLGSFSSVLDLSGTVTHQFSRTLKM